MDARGRDEVVGEIRAWMGRRDLSQSDLARALGVAPSWVSKRFAGEVELSLADLFEIASILDVPIGVFFERPPANTESRPTRYSSSQGGTTVPRRPAAAHAAA